MKNFLKKLAEIYLHGLLINGQNQVLMYRALWSNSDKDFNQNS